MEAWASCYRRDWRLDPKARGEVLGVNVAAVLIGTFAASSVETIEMVTMGVRRVWGWLTCFGRFWYGFIIGDDWAAAAGVLVMLAWRTGCAGCTPAPGDPARWSSLPPCCSRCGGPGGGSSGERARPPGPRASALGIAGASNPRPPTQISGERRRRAWTLPN